MMKNSMTNDEMSDLISGYQSDDSSIGGEDKATVLVCDKIKNPEKYMYTYSKILKSLSEMEKDI